MKEIIYLDTDLMNSMLAQLDKGLINNFSLEESNQQAESEGSQSSRGKNAGLRGSINVSTGFLPGGGLRLDSNLGNNGSESTTESRTILEGQKDILNKAFHDYALEVLTNKLVEQDYLNRSENLNEGDIYLGESTYRFYDFNLINNAMDYDFMRDLLLTDVEKLEFNLSEAKKLLEKATPSAKERQKLDIASAVVAAHENANPILDVFEKMNIMGKFASKLLNDLVVIKADKNIGLLKKKYLRESSEALSFRTDNSRQVKYLVRVIGKKEKIFTGENIQMLKEDDLDIIPNLMVDVLLGSFKIIKEGDLIVTPIAIYYE